MHTARGQGIITHTTGATLWMDVVKDRRRTSALEAMYCSQEGKKGNVQ